MSIFNIFSSRKQENLELNEIIKKLNTVGCYLDSLSEEEKNESPTNKALKECTKWATSMIDWSWGEYDSHVCMPKDSQKHFSKMFSHYRDIGVATTNPGKISSESIEQPKMFIDYFKNEKGSNVFAVYEKEIRQPRRISSHSQNVASASKKEEKILTRA
mgnify:FL=1